MKEQKFHINVEKISTENLSNPLRKLVEGIKENRKKNFKASNNHDKYEHYVDQPSYDRTHEYSPKRS